MRDGATVTTAVQINRDEVESLCFRATAGTRQSVGRTPGEALDALLAAEDADIESSAILIQRFVPDQYFTRAQYERMQHLLANRSTLGEQENAELDALIDAELDATIARTDALTIKPAAR